MSTLHEIKGSTMMITKGAVDVLMDRMDYLDSKGEVRPMTQEDRERIERQNQKFSRNGLVCWLSLIRSDPARLR